MRQATVSHTASKLSHCQVVQWKWWPVCQLVVLYLLLDAHMQPLVLEGQSTQTCQLIFKGASILIRISSDQHRASQTTDDTSLDTQCSWSMLPTDKKPCRSTYERTKAQFIEHASYRHLHIWVLRLLVRNTKTSTRISIFVLSQAYNDSHQQTIDLPELWWEHKAGWFRLIRLSRGCFSSSVLEFDCASLSGRAFSWTV